MKPVKPSEDAERMPWPALARSWQQQADQTREALRALGERV